MYALRTALAGLTIALTAPSIASAQDTDVTNLDDLDALEEQEEISKPTKRQVKEEQKALAEVVHGFYTQAMLVDTKFLGTTILNDALFPVGTKSGWGLGVKTSIGYDIVDNPSFTFTLEGSYAQAAFNGSGYANSDYQSVIQGDFRGHFFQLGLKPAIVVGKSRRISIFAKGFGGIFLSPSSVSDELVATYAPDPSLHGTPKPMGGGSVGVEYYSKLSHFSVTLFEAEFYYVVGFDTAASFNFVGMKYTF